MTSAPDLRSPLRADKQFLKRQGGRIDALGENSMLNRDRSGTRPPRPRKTGRSWISSGPRTTGTPTSAESRSRLARHRPGKMTTVCANGARQSAQQDGFGHQGRNLDAYIADLPGKRRLAHGSQQPIEAWIGEMAGDERMRSLMS